MMVVVVVLALRPRDGNQTTGADGKERLHLGGEHGSALYGLRDGGKVGAHPGAAENHVAVEVVKVAVAEDGMYAERGQLRQAVGELFGGLAVTDGDPRAGVCKQPDERAVRYADAQHVDAFTFQRREIF